MLILKSLLQRTRGVFASVSGSMAQMARECEVSSCNILFSCRCSCWIQMWTCFVLQRFYNSGCCTEPSDADRRHLSRFHQSTGSRVVTPATAPEHKVGLISDCCFISPQGGRLVYFRWLSHLHVNFYKLKRACKFETEGFVLAESSVVTGRRRRSWCRRRCRRRRRRHGFPGNIRSYC